MAYVNKTVALHSTANTVPSSFTNLGHNGTCVLTTYPITSSLSFINCQVHAAGLHSAARDSEDLLLIVISLLLFFLATHTLSF
ncbi:hypothetical protein F5877DRAFT_86494 [Lentinula edodes]|nr:hypothetical protein F5877DRAFT_86494 [Lentinula edodes]